MAASDAALFSRAPLLAWVAAFVLHRALLLAFGFDGVFFWEEAYRLLAAEALRDGWNIPVHDLQADPYSGGSLVYAVLAALVTSITGSSLVVLKCIALAWNAAGLWLWLLVADRVFGRPAAHALGLLWLAAPPVFLVFNLVAMGFHGDTVTLAGLQTLLLYRYLEDPRRSVAKLAAWMAVAGFSVWFSYASALTVAAGAGYALLAGALPPRRWGAALAAFAAGFSPWIAHYLAADGSLEVLSRTFAGGDAPGAGYLARLFDLAVHGVPVALYFRDIGIPGDVKLAREWLAYPYLAACAASFAALAAAFVRRFAEAQAPAPAGGGRLPRWRTAVLASPELAIVAVFPLFLVVLAASDQEFNDYGTVRFFTFRVLVAALPSLFFAMALALARAPSRLRRVAVAGLGALGLVATLQVVADGRAGLPAREAEARQLGAEAMGHLLVVKHGTSPLVGERIAALPGELRGRAWRGVGFNLAFLYGTQRSAQPASELADQLRAIDPLHRADGVEGARLAVGAGIDQVAGLPPSPRSDELRAAVNRLAAAGADDPSKVE
ncbi:MAG: hypothetical protein ABR538_04880 [Candidatus Binatia bacterium]